MTEKRVCAISMPIGAKILKIAQRAKSPFPNIWALVDDKNECEARFFSAYGTGEEINTYTYDQIRFIDTFISNDGFHVWHVFELLAVAIYKEGA